MSHRFMWLGLVLLFVIAAPIIAQDSVADWQTWLYDYTNGRVWLIDSQGNQVLHRTLPLSPDGAPPGNVIASPDGTRLAYQVTDGLLHIYEPSTEDIRSFSTPVGIRVANFDSYAFSDNGTLFGAGYIDTMHTNWQVVVYDLTTLAPIILTSTDPMVIALGAETRAQPFVRYINEYQVWFTLVDLEWTGNTNFSSYVWNLTTNSLQRTGNYLTMAADTLRPTWEVVIATENLHLPISPIRVERYYANTYGFNALEVYNPKNSTRTPFYHDAEHTFRTPRFIENGARIVVSAVAPDYESYFLVLGRDGHRFGYWQGGSQGITGDQYRGVPDGFIYVQNNEAFSTLYYVETATTLASDFLGDPGHEVPIWHTTEPEYLSIIWTSQGITDYTSLPAWAQLTVPVLDPTTGSVEVAVPLPIGVDVAVPQPTDSNFKDGTAQSVNKVAVQCDGALPSRLQIGQVGRVTPGEPNTLRETASLTSKRLGSVSGGEAFKVLDGPVCADAHAWFKVDYNGLIGWTAEGDASIYWLEPAG